MGKTYQAITDKLQDWMSRQHVFFVATAPLNAQGLVNCSPKGHDALRIIDDRTLMYLDYSGSGAETIAHLRENGRIVVMLCAFEGPPKIVRFHGKGRVIPITDPAFAALAARYDRDLSGVRCIVQVDVERISDSCGYGVPHYEYQDGRQAMQNYLKHHGDEGIAEYRLENNLESLDGLPALTVDEASALASKIVTK